MNIKVLCCGLAFIFTYINKPNHACSQLPTTDIYSFEVKIKDDYELVLSAPKLVNSFNRDGYNNQPSYAGSDTWYITAAEDKKEFTDILFLDFKNMSYANFTLTEGISEFSPTLSLDGRSLYTVRIEKDLKTQTLWQYPKDKSGYGKNILPFLKNVGYFTQIDPSHFAVYEVGEPQILNVYHIHTKNKKTVVQNPGRCLKTNSLGQLIFVHKLLPDLYFLKSYDHLSSKTIALSQIKSEDFEIIDDKLILSFDGTKLVTLQLEKDKNWRVVKDLSIYGINSPNRLVYGNGRLLVINSRK